MSQHSFQSFDISTQYWMILKRCSFLNNIDNYNGKFKMQNLNQLQQFLLQQINQIKQNTQQTPHKTKDNLDALRQSIINYNPKPLQKNQKNQKTLQKSIGLLKEQYISFRRQVEQLLGQYSNGTLLKSHKAILQKQNNQKETSQSKWKTKFDELYVGYRQIEKENARLRGELCQWEQARQRTDSRIHKNTVMASNVMSNMNNTLCPSSKINSNYSSKNPLMTTKANINMVIQASPPPQQENIPSTREYTIDSDRQINSSKKKIRVFSIGKGLGKDNKQHYRQ